MNTGPCNMCLIRKQGHRVRGNTKCDEQDRMDKVRELFKGTNSMIISSKEDREVGYKINILQKT